MASVTGKQIKKKRVKTGSIPNLGQLASETTEERKELQAALGEYEVVTFDIEATSLNASFGYALCAAIKPIGKKARIYRIDDYPSYKQEPWDDSKLVEDISKDLERCDIVVTWNGEGYDMPFIDQRLAVHNLNRIGSIHHIDLLPIARKKLRMHSNRLEAVAETLKVKTSKTHLLPEVWQRAGAGHKPSLDYIVEHNIADVQVLEEIFIKLKSFIDAIYRKR